jgi:branched-chain amino acid transport system substrate-binding protein
MKQAQELGISTPMLGTDGWDSPNLAKIAGKRAIRGHYFMAHFSSEDPDPKVQNFVNSYRRRFESMPTIMSAMGYDGMLMLADAFAKAQTNLPGPLIRALESIRKVDGLLGPIHFTNNNTVIKPAVVLATTGSGWRFHSRVIPDFTSNNQGG